MAGLLASLEEIRITESIFTTGEGLVDNAKDSVFTSFRNIRSRLRLVRY